MRFLNIAIVIVFGAMNCAADEAISFLGRATCASATCHGGTIGAGPAWNHSQTKWLADDPHVDAGMLLRHDPLSKQIVQTLEPDAAYDHVLRRRCISCHVTSTLADCSSETAIDDATLATGVSCESCHGPAERWLDDHVTKTWPKRDRFNENTGMRDTESIMGVAQTCVRCHVGSRREDGLVRDMNHDLIAAGHPVLRFDLALYLDRLPKHWASSGASAPPYQRSALALRQVGRDISLAAAASLSGERAVDHLKGDAVPWPELADYDCFGCHQSLSIDEFKLPLAQRRRSPLHVSDGLPIWNAWHTIGQVKLRDNQAMLKRLSPHRSDPADVAQLCKNLATKLRKLAIQHTTSPADAMDVINQIRSAAEPLDWNEAAMVYLELDAALSDLAATETPSQTHKEKRSKLHSQVEPLLRFDPQHSITHRQWNSPHAFDSEGFHRIIMTLLHDL